MYIVKSVLLLVFFVSVSCSGLAQKPVQNARLVGGPCQGCEAVLDFEDPSLTSVDTLPDFEQNEPKIKITGTIYEEDGTTPAEGVILFVHQTNPEGEYPIRGGEKGWEKSYGYIHGWIKTGADGKYTFYTFRPGKYGRTPAHIHPVILEPNGKYYWLGSYFFDDDPRLTVEHLSNKPRGGSSGVLSLKKQDGILVGERDFVLGKNIRDYE